MDKTCVIEIKNIVKSFDIGRENFLRQRLVNMFRRKKEVRFIAINGISLKIYKGECVGLWGRNGSGKSTLLKMMSGLYKPDSGLMRIKGKVASVLELGVGLHPELTGKENIFFYSSILGIQKEKWAENYKHIVDFFGFPEFINTPIKKYSTGMKSRLAFSIAVCSDADILFLDEVLSVGDTDFRERALNKILEFKGKKTIVFTAHSYTLMQQLGDRMINLNKGMIVASSNSIENRFLREIDDDTVIKVEATSSSMEPTIRKGDQLTVKKIPYEKLEIGDVVAFIFSNIDEMVVHRIVAKRETLDGHVKCFTKGDFSYEVDPWLLGKKDYLGRVIKIKRATLQGLDNF